MEKFNTPTGKRAIYYHTNWSCYSRNYQVKDIPSDVIDIAYAFFNIDKTGKVFSGDSWADFDKRYIGEDSVSPPDSWNDNNRFYGNIGQFKKLLDNGRKLNIQLSIGGWTWSKHFSTAFSSPIGRTNFVTSLIDIFNKYNVFNGVSIDWEYLSDNGINYGDLSNSFSKDDGENFVLLLQELKNSLIKNNMSHYTISFCCTAAPEKANFPIEKINPLINELHIMSYDFADGNWGDKITRHHTNPRKSSYGKWSCEEAAEFYISKGVPSTKIFIGGAFYSRGFSNTNGLGTNASGGSSDISWEKGIVDYKDLPKKGSIEYFDSEAKAAYSYDSSNKIFNSYDNKDSLIEKCKIIYEKNLGGIIIWENSSDFPYNHERSLTKVLTKNLTHGKPENIVLPEIEIQDSQQLPQMEQLPQTSKFSEWECDKQYKVNDIVLYNKKFYQCRISHTSIKQWIPNLAPALWKNIENTLIPQITESEEIIQEIQDSYQEENNDTASQIENVFKKLKISFEINLKDKTVNNTKLDFN